MVVFLSLVAWLTRGSVSERGGEEVLSAGDFHGRSLSVFDCFAHFTFSTFPGRQLLVKNGSIGL